MTQAHDDGLESNPRGDDQADDWQEEPFTTTGGSALGDLAARLVRAGAEAVSISAEKIREKGEDLKAKELVSGAAVLTSKGKDELVNLLANEVRSYVEKLRLGEEVHAFLTEHSLEINATLRLKKCDDRQLSEQSDDGGDPELAGGEGLEDDELSRADD